MPAEIGTSTPCHHCGEAVTPDQAYLCEIENLDGSSETVVFHKGMDKLCGLIWGTARLQDLAGRMEAIVALMSYVFDGREQK